MNMFEDDAAQDDFKVEITDLDLDEEGRPISAAIAALRSRISFNARAADAEDADPSEDFEVEVTDLPGNEGKSGSTAVPVVLEALRSRLPRKARIWRLAILGIAILLMLAVILGSLPAVHDTVFSLFAGPTPTPTPDSTTIELQRFGRSITSSSVVIIPEDSNSGIVISSTPLAGATVTPWSPTTNVSDVLGRVPQDCPFDNVPQDEDSQFSNFPYSNDVGGPPLWVVGFEGIPAKLVDFTRAYPAQYGWVRQITLVLESDATGPVMLQGAHLIDETPLLFGDPTSGQSPTTFLTLNLNTFSSPNSGASGTQWATRTVSLYIPAAGCYFLKASWAGGSWEAIFAAGQY